MKIVATYKTYAEFSIPKQYKDFPLKCFEVRWGKLTIWDPKTGNALVEDMEPKYDPEETMDWKRPATTTIEEDSDDDKESDDEKNIHKCHGDYCGNFICRDESYYLHFPDGSEEYYCEECKSSLNDN